MKTLAVLFAALITAGSAWSVAQADEHQGRHRGHQHQQQWQNGQCYNQNAQRGDRHEDSDDDDDNGRSSNNGQYGQYGNNGQYGQYGQNGQYGNNGQYATCGQNGGQYGRGGNTVVSGMIVAVNGNQVTLAQQNLGSTVTINDQPALDRQTSGRVSVGRYVNAYGYWQNGVFYATQMN